MASERYGNWEGSMTAPKRIALALGCLLFAFAAFAILGVVPTLIRYGSGPGMRSMEMMPVYLAVAIAGWLLTIPFVIAFKDANGWRLWATLVIGTAIGPVFLLAPELVMAGQINWQGNGGGVVMSLYVGFPTTVFYVLILRRFSRSARVDLSDLR